jgi:excisionase family DNA binding protein
VKKKSAAPLSANSAALQPRCLDIKAAAEYMAATPCYLRSLIWERKIPFAKRGNKYVFDRLDLDAFITASKTAAC